MLESRVVMSESKLGSGPIIVIVGPTASGKSALAMEISQQIGGEIICADSRTVYRGLDIGTAKPTNHDRMLVRHHLLDVCGPSDHFNAARFKDMALQAIDEIRLRQRIPIVVGGTGLYIDALIFDYSFGAAADPATRRSLEKLDVRSLQNLCRLYDIDMPQNLKNKRYLIRAIELGGLRNESKQLRPNTIVVGIAVGREELRQRIETRARAMLRGGLLDEVASYLKQYGLDHEAMTGGAYKEFRGVLDCTKTADQALEDFIRSDMRLAKRQMTWFKRNKHIHWSENKDELLEYVKTCLKSYADE